MDKEQIPVDYFFHQIKTRQEEALSSAVFKIENDDESCKRIYDIACNCGKLIKMYKFETNSMKYVLLEMENGEQLSNLINHGKSSNGGGGKRGKFSILNSLGGHFGYFNDSIVYDCEKIIPTTATVMENYDYYYSNVNNNDDNSKTNSIRKLLKEYKTLDLDNQIRLLHDSYKLNDLGYRLRYMMWKQMQNLVNVLLPAHSVYPFGSAVNGLGDVTSDLDLVVLRDDSTSFRWHKNPGVDINSVQNDLSLLTNVMSKISVGCTKVVFIKQAKVPIIKYKHSFTGVECDVSMHQTEALKMSQILFALSNFDPRIKPLIFFIKIWARELRLTREQPGPTITNFSLILLTIFFLQQKGSSHTEILPPFDLFPLRDTDPNDDVMTMENTDEKLEFILNNFKCHVTSSSSSSTSSPSAPPPNGKSTVELLLLFYKFYSVFNFNSYGCCLNTGQIIRKNNFKNYGMYIKNPFCSIYNVSKNVSLSEVNKFQFYCQIAATLLEESETISRNSTTRTAVVDESKFLLNFLNYNSYANELMAKKRSSNNNNINSNVKFADLKSIF